MFFAARRPERIGPWNVPEVIERPLAEVSRVEVTAAVDPAGDRAVSRGIDRVAGPTASLGVSPKDDRAVSQVVVLVIGTSADRRSARPVIGQMADQAASPGDNAVAKGAPLVVAVPVRAGHPMSVRSASLVPWVPPSPKKLTSPNLIQLF